MLILKLVYLGLCLNGQHFEWHPGKSPFYTITAPTPNFHKWSCIDPSAILRARERDNPNSPLPSAIETNHHVIGLTKLCFIESPSQHPTLSIHRFSVWSLIYQFSFSCVFITRMCGNTLRLS